MEVEQLIELVRQDGIVSCIDIDKVQMDVRRECDKIMKYRKQRK